MVDAPSSICGWTGQQWCPAVPRAAIWATLDVPHAACCYFFMGGGHTHRNMLISSFVIPSSLMRRSSRGLSRCAATWRETRILPVEGQARIPEGLGHRPDVDVHGDAEDEATDASADAETAADTERAGCRGGCLGNRRAGRHRSEARRGTSFRDALRPGAPARRYVLPDGLSVHRVHAGGDRSTRHVQNSMLKFTGVRSVPPR